MNEPTTAPLFWSRPESAVVHAGRADDNRWMVCGEYVGEGTWWGRDGLELTCAACKIVLAAEAERKLEVDAGRVADEAREAARGAVIDG